jgi:hypothetical protein
MHRSERRRRTVYIVNHCHTSACGHFVPTYLVSCFSQFQINTPLLQASGDPHMSY